MKRFLIGTLIVSLLFCVGCQQQNGRAAFLSVLQDHAKLTTETNKAVLNTLNEEYQKAKDVMPSDRRAGIEDLMLRLDYISKQSEAIKKYSFQNATERDISELLKLRWYDGQK